jgi:hypothetical protein
MRVVALRCASRLTGRRGTLISTAANAKMPVSTTVRPSPASPDMVFEHIEKLKQQYTDKYVVVDEQRPELRRFRGRTGTVRTVNMSGRALVEFEGDNNIGWYDIDLDFLKVIDAPLPKPEKEKPAKKEAKAAPAKAEKAAKPAAAKPAGKMSVEEMLAAARTGGKAGAAPAAKAVPPAEQAEAKPAKKPGAMSVEEMLAAARGEKSAGAKAAAPKAEAAAKAPAVDGNNADAVRAKLEAARKPASGGESKAAPASAPAKGPKSMSVADILAAARGEKGGAVPSAAKAPEPASTAVEEPDEQFVLEESAEQAPAKAAPVSRDQLPTSVDEIVAFCRQIDTK